MHVIIIIVLNACMLLWKPVALKCPAHSVWFPEPAPMQPFLVEADQQMEALLQLYTKMKLEYQTAARFFGEDPLKMRIDDFFGAFATFVDDFEVINTQLVRIVSGQVKTGKLQGTLDHKAVFKQ